MADQIQRYCKVHKTAVTIDRSPSGERVVLLICRHTGDPTVFKCSHLECVYSTGAQAGAAVAARMGTVRLNTDGTIPLDVIKRTGCVDYTSELP